MVPSYPPTYCPPRRALLFHSFYVIPLKTPLLLREIGSAFPTTQVSPQQPVFVIVLLCLPSTPGAKSNIVFPQTRELNLGFFSLPPPNPIPYWFGVLIPYTAELQGLISEKREKKIIKEWSSFLTDYNEILNLPFRCPCQTQRCKQITAVSLEDDMFIFLFNHICVSKPTS